MQIYRLRVCCQGGVISLFNRISICVGLYEIHPCGGGARGVIVIVVGNGHGDMSSNPGRD